MGTLAERVGDTSVDRNSLLFIFVLVHHAVTFCRLPGSGLMLSSLALAVLTGLMLAGETLV